MKRALLLLSLMLLSALAVLPARSVAAAELKPFQEACEQAPESEVCQAGNENPVSGSDGVLLRVVNILSFVVGVAAVLMVMLGGFKYITSAGDANSISSAKNTILYAIIGLIVFLLSQGIIAFVIRRI